MVPLAIVADGSVPPELVDKECPGNGDAIVDLVVVAHPGSDESPHGLPGGVSSQARDLGCFAAYMHAKNAV